MEDSNEGGGVPLTTPAMLPRTPSVPVFAGFKSGKCGRSSSLLTSLKCLSTSTNVEAYDIEHGTHTKLPSVSYSFSPAPITLARKVGAEFIGTFMLIFAGAATPIVNQKTQGSETLVGLAASSGIAVMIIILSTGHISGAHLNPAITIAFAALKRFPWNHVPVYIGAQIMASLSASFALREIFKPIMGGGVTVPSGGYVQAFALEFIISFILMFVVTSVSAHSSPVGELAGIAVGATVMLNILIAGETTGASMNPVRTLGPAIVANNYKGIWIYLTAPILGALCGAGAYSAVNLTPKVDDVSEKGTNI